jgi:hypothetical protein
MTIKHAPCSVGILTRINVQDDPNNVAPVGPSTPEGEMSFVPLLEATALVPHQLCEQVQIVAVQ